MVLTFTEPSTEHLRRELSYFKRLTEDPSYTRSEATLRFTYNANSGGGQQFLAGKYQDTDGSLRTTDSLNTKNATLQYYWGNSKSGRYKIKLDDPSCQYEIGPRAKNNRSMKFVIGNTSKKVTPSKAISAFLMLPNTATINRPEDINRSILSANNYWLYSMPLDYEGFGESSSSVRLSAKEFIFAGGVEDDKEDSAVYFQLDASRRIRDIVKISRHSSLTEDIGESLRQLSLVYLGQKKFDYEECRYLTDQLMVALASEYPEEYSGITDPLPILLAISDADEAPALRFVTGVESTFERNRLSFGAPGTGKSYLLNEQMNRLLAEGGEFERVTFHPDYAYSHFVGTYRPVPVLDEDGRETISYKYVPGPFMRLLARSLANGRTADPVPHLLLIEEINRANASAVFGEVFQLLDRGPEHASEYPIHPGNDIRTYLADQLGGSPEDFSALRIPDNLFIWGSMNSADQGVFPMDTAFKRRWNFSYIGVDDNEAALVGKNVILGRDKHAREVEWNSLRRAINDYLAINGINEDKQLGPYFMDNKVLQSNGEDFDSARFCEAFKSKVLMYLFEDAARPIRGSMFEGVAGGGHRYSDVCREFDRSGLSIFNSQIVDKVFWERVVSDNDSGE